MLFVNDGNALDDLDPGEFDEWTKADPTGKLHNLVVWVSRSNKITTALRSLQNEDLEMNYPGALDGDALSWLKDILEMFDSCLLRLERNGQVRLRKGGAEAQYDIVWEVAIAYKFLLATLEKSKLEAKDQTEPRYNSSYINSGWAKLNKEGWIDKARHLIQTLSEEEYRYLPAQWETGDSNLPVAVRAREYNPFDSFQDELMSCPNSEEESVADEFERWQSTKQDTFSKHDNPLEYWSAKRFEFPRVAKMAIDVLSVPAMAAERERAFSSAGSMVSPQRTRLDASTIAVTQTVRSWLKAGLLEGYDGLLKETSGEVAGVVSG
ncbi:HAT, C-terminal dimerization domain [Fusarium oxysporum f. sp. vasinfectum]|nr:HAT, C-terminal dimerization domain [Fusarium oxysporum f. sp. vasinfectum]